MSKITKHNNYRVIIEPKGLGNFGSVRVSDSFVSKNEQDRQKQYKERCEEIMDQVKRHVDNIGSVEIEYDTEEICSLCGRIWELDEETGEPTCCNEAIEEFNNEKTSQQSDNQ